MRFRSLAVAIGVWGLLGGSALAAGAQRAVTGQDGDVVFGHHQRPAMAQLIVDELDLGVNPPLAFQGHPDLVPGPLGEQVAGPPGPRTVRPWRPILGAQKTVGSGLVPCHGPLANNLLASSVGELGEARGRWAGARSITHRCIMPKMCRSCLLPVG